ncbi:reverse transcriptase [Tanacetum coccineum]
MRSPEQQGHSAVIKEFDDVFVVPKSLPPQRSHDHQFPLQNGTPRINIRPYKHPRSQKDAIESMVKELHYFGVIRTSQSPFSSLIVMVKNKDGSWRMCVDYRLFNKYTMKDKFTIPMIEELIDELHRAKMFSKLDLTSGKCNFAVTHVEYLGHIISAPGVSTDPVKITTMKDWPMPKNIKQLRGFLGLTRPRWLPKVAWYDYQIMTRKEIRKGAADATCQEYINDNGLHASNGKTTIFVVVDRLSKYAHFIPLHHPFTAAQVAQAFMDNVYKLHGLPETINFVQPLISHSPTYYMTHLLRQEKGDKLLKIHMKRAHDRMKSQANKHRSDRSFEVGSWVYLKLQPPHRQVTARQGPYHKLSAKFYGPFMIEEKIGAVAYKLKLPNGSQIHLVFHVSQLKQCKGMCKQLVVYPI